MNPKEIKAKLESSGFSIAMIARALQKSPNTVSGVINRHTTSTEVANGLSKILKTPVTELVPDVPTYSKPHLHEKKQSEILELLNS